MKKYMFLNNIIIVTYIGHGPRKLGRIQERSKKGEHYRERRK